MEDRGRSHNKGTAGENLSPFSFMESMNHSQKSNGTILRASLNGMSPNSRMLQKDELLEPPAYSRSRSPPTGGTKDSPSLTRWTGAEPDLEKESKTGLLK